MEEFDIMRASLDDLGDYLHDMQAEAAISSGFIRRRVACLDDIDMSIFSPYIKDLEDTVKRASSGCCRVVTVKDTHVMTSDYSFKDGHKDVHSWMTSVYLVWHGELPSRSAGKAILRAIRDKENLL